MAFFLAVAALAAFIILSCEDMGEDVVVSPNASGDTTDWAEVQPIFQQHCVNCHNPSNLGGGLNLETHAGVLAGGNHGAAVVPGNPDGSLLVRTLEGTSAEVSQMPLGAQALSAALIAVVRDWIADGAGG